MEENSMWLIWSNEHNGWWLPASHGYTQSRERAGAYSFEEAKKIVREANITLQDVPNEAMIELLK